MTSIFDIGKSRLDNPLKRKARAKKIEAGKDFYSLNRCDYMSSTAGGVVPSAGPKRPNVQMPDEYLPPNKILFLQNLVESVTKEQLTSLFSQYVSLLRLVTLTFARLDILICRKSDLSLPRKTSLS